MNKDKFVIKNTLPGDDDYNRLFNDAGWGILHKEVLDSIRAKTCFGVSVLDGGLVIGMGRIIGDGLHYNLVDIVGEGMRYFKEKRYGGGDVETRQ